MSSAGLRTQTGSAVDIRAAAAEVSKHTPEVREGRERRREERRGLLNPGISARS